MNVYVCVWVCIISPFHSQKFPRLSNKLNDHPIYRFTELMKTILHCLLPRHEDMKF